MNLRFLFGLFALIALVLTVTLLVVRGLGGDEEPQHQINLADYTQTDAVVSLTIDGKINAEQDHQAVRITVGRSEAQLDILHGYNQVVAQTHRFTNTTESYATFLRALQLLGFTKGSSDETMADERGFCPDGNRYIFTLKDGDNTLQRYWRTTCKQGTYLGETTDTLSLFKSQIPEYRVLTKDVDL